MEILKIMMVLMVLVTLAGGCAAERRGIPDGDPLEDAGIGDADGDGTDPDGSSSDGDDGGDDGTDWDVDGDGDGSDDADGDLDACDAPEVCGDGLDNDCDGEVDEGYGEGEDCPAESCLDLHERRPSLASDVYWTLDAHGEPTSVYCDMTIDGGGWTALINPVDLMLPGTHPDLTFEGSATPGTGSCPATPLMFTEGDWRGVRAYVCGRDTIRLSLSWSGSADDVMFLATVQGQETHSVTINGVEVPPDAETGAYMNCLFWNDGGDLVYPEANTCWSTVLAGPVPHLELDALGVEGLVLEIEAGPSCSPDCSHGAGLNISQLHVR